MCIRDSVTRVKFNGNIVEIPYFFVYEEIAEQIVSDEDGCCSYWRCVLYELENINRLTSATSLNYTKSIISNLISGQTIELAIKTATTRALPAGVVIDALAILTKCEFSPYCGPGGGCDPGQVCLLTERSLYSVTISSETYTFGDSFSSDCWDCPQIVSNEFDFEIDIPLHLNGAYNPCLLYTSPSPRDATLSRMPSSA